MDKTIQPAKVLEHLNTAIMAIWAASGYEHSPREIYVPIPLYEFIRGNRVNDIPMIEYIKKYSVGNVDVKPEFQP